MTQEELTEVIKNSVKEATKDLTEKNKTFIEDMEKRLDELGKPAPDAKTPTAEEKKEQDKADSKSWKSLAEFAHVVAIAGKTHERVVDKRLVANAELKATDLSEGNSEYGGYGQNALVKPCYMLETPKANTTYAIAA